MPNSRTIPGHLWEHAQRALVFYFAHHGAVNAEDLAQDTLAEVWRRSDYEFRKDADFLRVCYAFARLILKADWRRERQRADAEMAHCREGAPARSGFYSENPRRCEGEERRIAALRVRSRREPRLSSRRRASAGSRRCRAR